MLRIPLILLATALAIATAHAAGSVEVKSDVINNEGKTIGTFLLRGTNRGVVGRLELAGGAVKPGWHGIHFHSVGDCSDTAKFEHSMGHVNLRNREHGLLNPKGPDNGDLPNVFAAADGSVNAEVSSQLVSLRGKRTLLDADGSALIIHANPDDYVSQPIGGAGDRIACAALKSR
jgi:Cu-Zn family superoxide dismutase